MLELFEESVGLLVSSAIDWSLLGHVHLEIVVLALKVLKYQLFAVIFVLETLKVTFKRVYFLDVVQLILLNNLIFK